MKNMLKAEDTFGQPLTLVRTDLLAEGGIGCGVGQRWKVNVDDYYFK